MLDAGELRCDDCDVRLPQWSTAWRCACGGTLSWHLGAGADASPGGPGLWRWAGLLPPVRPENRVTLGETTTPVLEHRSVGYKLEYLSPSGSFKDRGAACVASCLRQMEVHAAVVDSSGNAGAAMATYLAAAGIEASVFVPEHTSAGKLRQIGATGARLITVAGDRTQATAAAQTYAESTGAIYAGHLWSPYFIAGMRTFGAELGEFEALDAVVFPVGSGSLVLGAYDGLAAIQKAEAGPAGPRLFGVQVEACQPLVAAYSAGLDELPPATPLPGASIAEGVLIARPPRARAILQSVRRSGGALIGVGEEEVRQATKALWHQGIYAEPTSAVAEAGRLELIRGGLLATTDRVIVVLTGNALKTSS